jgi:release factor glutamine methyltransferase
MAQTVYGFEPHAALFVPNEDPLLFYAALAESAWETLKPEGVLAVEVNERFGKEVSTLFHEKGYMDVRLHTDISGKDRIVIVRKPDKNEFDVNYKS